MGEYTTTLPHVVVGHWSNLGQILKKWTKKIVRDILIRTIKKSRLQSALEIANRTRNPICVWEKYIIMA